MYLTIRHILSKRQNTNHLKIYYRTDESDLSSKLSSNVVNVDSINTQKTVGCNKSFYNKLLSDQTLKKKKYNKRKEENKNSTFFNCQIILLIKLTLIKFQKKILVVMMKLLLSLTNK